MKKLITPTGHKVHLPRSGGGTLCGLKTARHCFEFVEGEICSTCEKARAAKARRANEKARGMANDE
jgi:hypothetical protein